MLGASKHRLGVKVGLPFTIEFTQTDVLGLEVDIDYATSLPADEVWVDWGDGNSERLFPAAVPATQVTGLPFTANIAVVHCGTGYLAVPTSGTVGSQDPYWADDINGPWTVAPIGDLPEESTSFLINPAYLDGDKTYFAARDGSVLDFEFSTKTWTTHRMFTTGARQSVTGLTRLGNGGWFFSIASYPNTSPLQCFTTPDLSVVTEVANLGNSTIPSYPFGTGAILPSGGIIIGSRDGATWTADADGANPIDIGLKGGVPSASASHYSRSAVVVGGQVVCTYGSGYGWSTVDGVNFTTLPKGLNTGSTTDNPVPYCPGAESKKYVHTTSTGWASESTDGLTFTQTDRWLINGNSPSDTGATCMSENQTTGEIIHSWNQGYVVVQNP